MDNMPAESLNDCPLGTTSRRKLLRTLGAAALGAPFAPFTFGQGQCRDGYGTQSCPLNAKGATAPIQAGVHAYGMEDSGAGPHHLPDAGLPEGGGVLHGTDGMETAK